MIITQSFDRKILSAMEIALDRACEHLGFARDRHDARRHIASNILECALHGDRTLGGLTEAGRVAAMEVLALGMEAPAVVAFNVGLLAVPGDGGPASKEPLQDNPSVKQL